MKTCGPWTASRTEIDRRTKKGVAKVSRIESRLEDVRARIERGTENLPLANRQRIHWEKHAKMDRSLT